MGIKPYNKINRIFYLAAFLVLCIPVLLAGCQDGTTAHSYSGIVETDHYDVIAEAPGTISEVFVSEGDEVHKGDVVAKIDDAAQKIAVSQAQTIVELANIKLESLKAGPTSAQLKQAESAKGAARASSNAAKETVTFWEDTVASMEANPATLPGDLANARYQLKLAKDKLSAAQWQYTSAKSAYEELKQAAQDAASPDIADSATGRAIRAAGEELKAAQAQLDAATLNLSKCEIKAQTDGTCTYMGIHEGDMCAPGGKVAQITDYSSLWVNIYIPQSELPYIRIEQQLKLNSVAFPEKEITGKIAYISDSAEFTPKNVETPQEKQATVFKVKIEITDGADFARPGMSVNAVIPLK